MNIYGENEARCDEVEDSHMEILFCTGQVFNYRRISVVIKEAGQIGRCSVDVL